MTKTEKVMHILLYFVILLVMLFSGAYVRPVRDFFVVGLFCLIILVMNFEWGKKKRMKLNEEDLDILDFIPEYGYDEKGRRIIKSPKYIVIDWEKEDELE